MTLFKKATASIALVALVSSVFTTGVSAYSASEVEAANKLASKGIINTQSDVANYNLGQNVLRQEIAKVAANVADIDAKTSCDDKFSDVSATTPNTWACGYVEALLDAGKISANAKFNPESNITKSEAVKMVLEAAGFTDIFTDAAKWQEQVVAFAAKEGVTESFTNYNTNATRGFIFAAAANAIEANSEEEDDNILDSILDDLGDEDETTDETTDETETPVVSGDNKLVVELSPSTADSATVPGNISGLPVASFDFTAGSEDITVSSVVVKRKGLSDKNTLTALAIFTEEGRASKAKNDSQENDTEATLTLSDGGVTVKAGETKTLTVVADINTALTTATPNANSDEFAIELLEVTATSSVEGVSNLVGNTMKVGGVDAASITIKTDGTVSDVKVWDESIEIFKFKVEGANDEDVILKSITFKGEGSIDEEDEMSNFQLEFDGDVIATTASANGKYVTFNLDDGITIAEGQNERFKVLADITAGVNETVSFKIDKTLDVTAEGTKYGFGASVDITAVDSASSSSTDAVTDDLGILDVEAGELTLSDIDAPADKIRADKDDVELGSIKINNVSGASLEMQTLSVTAAFTTAGFIDDGAGGGTAGNGTQDGTEAATTLATVFENFEAEINGTSYDLELNGSNYEDTDLTINLPEGVTTIVLKADTKKYVSANTKVALSVSNIGSTGFKAVELDEDTAVTDITPSSLSFKDVEFISAGAKLSASPLADVTVVRGSENIIANQFEVEAEEASFVEVDEVKVTVGGYTTGWVAVAAADAEKVIASVALYKGTISEANKLDEQSGTKISSAGLVTFDWFKTKIEANKTESFLVVISVVDGVDSESKTLTVDVNSISADDDDGDEVIVSGTALNNKDIAVTTSGTFTVDYDVNNDANEEIKTILAGTSQVLASYDVQSKNEDVDVETVVVTFDNNTGLSDAFLSAKLLLDGKVVGNATNSDLSGSAVTFSDLTMLEIPTESVELEVEVTTSTIGFEKVGSTIASNFITSIALNDVTGVDSGKTVTSQTELDDAKAFSVVDVVLTASVVKTLSNGTAQVKLTANSGDNTQAGSNSAPVVNLVSLGFTDNGNTWGGVNEYKVYEDGETAPAGFAAVNVAGASASVTSISFTDEVIINILPNGIKDNTYALDLNKDGVTYNTSLKSNMSSPLNLGTKTY